METLDSKIQIPSAVSQKTRKKYVQRHETTHSFLIPRPIFAREYIPKRDMTILNQSFVRCNPMPVPIFGRAKVHNRAFFVPFRTVMPDWDAFYTSSPFSYSRQGNSPVVQIPSHSPIVNNSVLVELFTSTNQFAVAGTSTSYDFIYYDSSDPDNPVTSYYKFTPLGIQLYSVFLGVGIKIFWNKAYDNYEHDAMKFLCYCKVLLDWYYPSAYIGDGMYQFLQGLFDIPVVDNRLSRTQIADILSFLLYCTYDNDYFVGAFDKPTGPNSVNYERNMAFPDITNDKAVRQVVANSVNGVGSPSSSSNIPGNGTPFIGGESTGSAIVPTGVTTQYVLDCLKSMTDLTKRHQLAGVRVLDRYLAELGVNLKSELLKRSMYIGSMSFDLEFYDVFSHSDTYQMQGSVLGAYAGKGFGYGETEFNFSDYDDFGCVIIVNSIIPEIGYYQGIHRENKHIYYSQYWHPDLDHLAPQAIGADELIVPVDGSNSVLNDSITRLDEHIFGFTSQFIEYNVPCDVQSGLFAAKSQSGLLPFYSLMRDVSWITEGDAPDVTDVTHNKGFVLGKDTGQYNRIFVHGGDKLTLRDNLIASHRFEVTQYDYTLPNFNTYEFSHGDENKKVGIEVNGSKVN